MPKSVHPQSAAASQRSQKPRLHPQKQWHQRSQSQHAKKLRPSLPVKRQRRRLKLNPRKSQAQRPRAMMDGMAQCPASWALGLGRLN
jgi:hypothetical protein